MSRVTRSFAIFGVVLSIGLASAGAVMTAQQASAVPVPQGHAGGHLSLEADTLPARWDDLSPGQWVDWEVWPVLAGQPDATLSLHIAHGGDLTSARDGLRLLLRRCGVPWAAGATASAPRLCGGGQGITIVDSPMADITQNTEFALGAITRGNGPYFLATLSIPSSMSISQQQAVQGWSGTFGFGFTAAGETETITPNGVLASTGWNPSGLLLLVLGLVVGGLALAGVRARPVPVSSEVTS